MENLDNIPFKENADRENERERETLYKAVVAFSLLPFVSAADVFQTSASSILRFYIIVGASQNQYPCSSWLYTLHNMNASEK